MTPEILIAITDQLGAGFAALRGNASAGTGCGHPALPLPEHAEDGEQSDYGLSLACRRTQDAILHSHDLGLISSILVNGPKHFQHGASLSGLAAGIYSSLVTSLSHQCRVRGVSTVRGLESYAAYYNVGAGGQGKCLLSPLYAELHALLYPSSPIAASSILSDPPQRDYPRVPA